MVRECAKPAGEEGAIVPVREGYQRWAEVYDGDGNPLAMDEQQFSAMLPDVSGRLIAGLGCGMDRHTARLAARGATVVALDLSSAMIGLSGRGHLRAVRGHRGSWRMWQVSFS
jgi:SAM-dependent methyltransferase